MDRGKTKQTHAHFSFVSFVTTFIKKYKRLLRAVQEEEFLITATE
jgi:hypothetical protein